MCDREILVVASTSVSQEAVNTVAIGRGKYDKKFLKLSRILKTKLTSKVWDHFGIMTYNDVTIQEVADRYYCRHCFDKGHFKFYKKTTGSTNLNDHLNSEHKISLAKATDEQNQRKINSMLTSSENIVPSKKDAQFIFNRHICLWLCRDLQPFHTVEKGGFLSLFSFLFKWVPFVKVPSRATVSISALNNIYTSLKSKLVTVLQNAPKYGSITFDGWTDKYRHRKYLTFTYHYIDHDWRTQSFVLQTSFLPDDSKSVTLKSEYLKMIESFKLEDKIITLVTDSGTNMLATCKSLNALHFPCIAHKIYRLISSDFLSHESMSTIKDLIDKLSQIQRVLLYRHDEMVQIENDKHRKAYENFLLDCVDYGKINSFHF